MTRLWRILAKALGEKAHTDPRIADRITSAVMSELCEWFEFNDSP